LKRSATDRPAYEYKKNGKARKDFGKNLDGIERMADEDGGEAGSETGSVVLGCIRHGRGASRWDCVEESRIDGDGDGDGSSILSVSELLGLEKNRKQNKDKERKGSDKEEELVFCCSFLFVFLQCAREEKSSS
jgi:hypothetical protein